AKQIPGLTILSGVEVDIRKNGTVDMDDETLAARDWVMASIHGGFDAAREELTKRVLAAMENPHVDCIGHPTGRKINRREAYDLDLEAVFAGAVETGTFLEINSQADRLDLKDVNAKAAIEAGVKLVISTDAHEVAHLEALELGVAQARRGWVTSGDVVNARPWAEARKLTKT
ncbi:MAG TPA: hypothetical protein VK285_05470, partial [Gaiellaceae bacterium]|nr:hypothetical protein [Gaiellaceae bacterium]